MIFTDIDLTDVDKIQSIVDIKGFSSCQFSGAGLWYYASKYRTCVAYDEDGFIYIKQDRPVLGTVYLVPIGNGDLQMAMCRLACYNKLVSHTDEMRIWGITDENKDEFLAAVPDAVLVPDRDWAEYIYSTHSLMHFPGRELHRQRNRLNCFMSDYNDRYIFEEASENNLDELWDFQCTHLNDLQKSKTEHEMESLYQEHELIRNALSNYNNLSLIGGLLRVDKSIVAYGFGATVGGKTFDYLCEKSSYNLRGSGLMLQRELIRNLLTNFSFVNREEDLGIDGLRQAKSRLGPSILLMKYTSVVDGAEIQKT